MYPGNHTESEILSVPRNLKTRPGAPETHLAYITNDEADLLEIYKPDTPHKGPHDIPNYDTWGYDPSGGGSVTGGSTADGGGAWSGDTNYSNPEPSPWSGSPSVDEVWANEFADSPEVASTYGVTYPPPEDSYDWTTSDYGGVDPEYQAYLDNLVRHTNDQGFSGYTQPGQSWFDRRDEQLRSAFGGYGGYDTGSGYLWDSLAGLSDADKTKMWREGEFPWPLGGSGTTGGPGPGPGRSGRYRSGSSGVREGSGGSRMQFPGAEGVGGIWPRWGPFTQQGDYIRGLRRANRGGIVSLC